MDEKTIRIVACIKFFENENTIERTLNSLTFVDRIVAIDGAYEGYCDYYRSKDDTIKKLEEFRDKTDIPTIIVHRDLQGHFKDEMEKRNFMFKDYFFSKNEWILFIDTDEYCIGEVDQDKLFKYIQENKNEPYFLITLYQRWRFIPPLERDQLNYWKRDKDSKLGKREFLRVFKFIPGIKLVGNHWTLMYPDLSMTKYFVKKAQLCPFEIMHEPEKSSDFTKKSKKNYNEFGRKKVEKRTVSARDVLDSGLFNQ